MSMYESAVKRPIMTALCFVAVVIFGLFSLLRFHTCSYCYLFFNRLSGIPVYSETVTRLYSLYVFNYKNGSR